MNENLITSFFKFTKLNKLVLLIGLPGSGKSSWIKQNQPNWKKTVVVSTDEIRKELSGNVNDQSKNTEVFQIAQQRVIENLQNDYNVIVDATNTETTLRQQWISEITSKVKCKLQAKIFYVGKEEAKRRIKKNLEKGKDRSNVLDNVIDLKYENYMESLKSLPYEGYEIIENYVE